MKIKFLVPCILVLSLLLNTTVAYAYSVTSIRFLSSVISYTYMSGSSNFNSAVTAAASNWTQQTNATLSNYTSGGKIFLSEGYSSVWDWDGSATPSLTAGGGNYAGFSIVINSYFTNNYTYNMIRSVVAHEFGHALSLKHVTDKVCLMLPTTNLRYTKNSIYTVQTDDKSGVNFMY